MGQTGLFSLCAATILEEGTLNSNQKYPVWILTWCHILSVAKKLVKQIHATNEIQLLSSTSVKHVIKLENQIIAMRFSIDSWWEHLLLVEAVIELRIEQNKDRDILKLNKVYNYFVVGNVLPEPGKAVYPVGWCKEIWEFIFGTKKPIFFRHTRIAFPVRGRQGNYYFLFLFIVFFLFFLCYCFFFKFLIQSPHTASSEPITSIDISTSFP